MRLSVGVWALAAVLCGDAMAAPSVITNPDWAEKPDPQSFTAYYPLAAANAQVNGRVVIRCVVASDGMLVDCDIGSEEPTGYGFAEAALKVASRFRMRPMMIDGRPVGGGHVAIPINFILPKEHRPQAIPPSSVDWLTAATVSEVAAAYPRKARKLGLDGEVQLNCIFSWDGTMNLCDILSESPQAFGFGEAAQKLAKRFKAPEVRADGAPIRESTTIIPFAFRQAMTPLATPAWPETPSTRDIAAALPPEVMRRVATLDASAGLDCVVQPSGALGDCKVASEAPAGLGLGDAALRLAPKFRAGLWTADGLPAAGARVRPVVRFGPAAGPAP